MASPRNIRYLSYRDAHWLKLENFILGRVITDFFKQVMFYGEREQPVAIWFCPKDADNYYYGITGFDTVWLSDFAFTVHQPQLDEEIEIGFFQYLENAFDVRLILFDLVPSVHGSYGAKYVGDLKFHRYESYNYFYIDRDSDLYPSSLSIFMPIILRTEGKGFRFRERGNLGGSFLGPNYRTRDIEDWIYGDTIYQWKNSKTNYFVPLIPLLGKVTGNYYCHIDPEGDNTLFYVGSAKGGLSDAVGAIIVNGTVSFDMRMPRLYPFGLESELQWDQLVVESPNIYCIVPSYIEILFVNELTEITWEELQGTEWWRSGIVRYIPDVDAKRITWTLGSVTGHKAEWNLAVSFPVYHVTRYTNILTGEKVDANVDIEPVLDDNKRIVYDFSTLFSGLSIYRVEGTIYLKSGDTMYLGPDFDFAVLHIGDVDISVSKRTYVSMGHTTVTYNITNGYVDYDGLVYEIAWVSGGHEFTQRLSAPAGVLPSMSDATNFVLNIYFHDQIVRTISIADIEDITIGDIPLPIAYYDAHENHVHVEWDDELYDCYEQLVNVSGITIWVKLDSSPYDWYPALGVNLAARYKLHHKMLDTDGPAITVDISKESVHVPVTDVSRKYVEIGEIKMDAYRLQKIFYFVYDTEIPQGAIGFKYYVYGDFDNGGLSYSLDGVHFQPFDVGETVYFPEEVKPEVLWVRFDSDKIRYIQAAYIKFIF